jgi:hypothetical protein
MNDLEQTWKGVEDQDRALIHNKPPSDRLALLVVS